MGLTRRELFANAALGWVGMTLEQGQAQAAENDMSENGALTYQHVPKPLSFDPKRLPGLSERLLVSHWENNYGGAVKALNVVRTRLTSALADPELPPYLYDDLKREQLMRTGSVVLHELYFGNLGGDGKSDAAIRQQVSASFGGFEIWEAEFRRMALGLAGGSGWVVLAYNRQLRLLENYWMADHSHAPAYSDPILVLDMYEHAYQMDYGAAAARYVDAFFQNLAWEPCAVRLGTIRRQLGA
jgi:Fe-Mn family superoxide dismutase